MTDTITREYLDSLYALRRAYFRSRMSEFVQATGRCEDFPCCGHTDGLGCDWVSPNEVSPVDELIEREERTYARAKARAEFDAEAVQGECRECQDEDMVQPFDDDVAYCFSCLQDFREEDRREREDAYYEECY